MFEKYIFSDLQFNKEVMRTAFFLQESFRYAAFFTALFVFLFIFFSSIRAQSDALLQTFLSAHLHFCFLGSRSLLHTIRRGGTAFQSIFSRLLLFSLSTYFKRRYSSSPKASSSCQLLPSVCPGLLPLFPSEEGTRLSNEAQISLINQTS